jgi:hypothetical protein
MKISSSKERPKINYPSSLAWTQKGDNYQNFNLIIENHYLNQSLHSYIRYPTPPDASEADRRRISIVE